MSLKIIDYDYGYTLFFSITIMIMITIIIFSDYSDDYGWLKLFWKFLLLIMTYYNKL